ncbi:MAG: TolC family protein [Phycisphaerales bacterium]|nr:TolC family protein [Phycisphaerales bacterium]
MESRKNLALSLLRILAITGAVGLAAPGCQTPLHPGAEDDWRNAMERALSLQTKPTSGSTEDEVPRPIEALSDPVPAELTARAEELRHLGPQSEAAGPGMGLGATVPGEEVDPVTMSLQEVIAAAVRNNLQVQTARLQQAVQEAQVVIAEAAFDMVFVAGGGYASTNEPQIAFVGGPPGVNKFQSSTMSAGIQKNLTSGGNISVAATQDWTQFASSGVYAPNPSWQTGLDLAYNQPLLRGFGTDVVEAEIHIARNNDRLAALQITTDLLSLVRNVEEQYWDLVMARQRVVAAQWLVEVGTQVREVLAKRRAFDATLADYADAVATVEQRQTNLIKAQLLAKTASDSLKLVMNDPQLPVGGDGVIVPVDWPVDQALTCSLRQSVLTAIERNPSIASAIIGIDSASINVVVADNGRLPQLDLAAGMAYNGLEQGLSNSWNDVVDGSFIDYTIGLALSQPIGNRAAEAQYRATRLQRSQAAIAYANAVQNVTYQVRIALREISANFQLIRQTNTQQMASAENLRALLVLEQTLASLTPEFLFLKFQRQDRLALAHLDQVSALIDYNKSIAALDAAMGTGLERSHIELSVDPVPSVR